MRAWGMGLRLLFVALIVALLAAPGVGLAAGLDRGTGATGDEKTMVVAYIDPGTRPNWLERGPPAEKSDKTMVVYEDGILTIIATATGEEPKLIQALFLVFISHVDMKDLPDIGLDPALCKQPECTVLRRDTVAQVAWAALDKRIEETPARIVADADRTKDASPERDEGKPADAVPAPPQPWWEKWLDPAIVIGATTALIGGVGVFFTVSHQRFQMRKEQAAAAAAAMASSPAAHLLHATGPAAPAPAAAKPARTRSRTSAPGGASPSSSRRTRSRA